MPRTSSPSRFRRFRGSRRCRSAASRSRRCACRSTRASSPRWACRWRTSANVITTATVDAPKGSINGPTRSLTIYDNDQLLKAAPWNDVVVAYKNGAAGAHPRHRRRGRRTGKHTADGMAKRPQRHFAADLQAARRQCHRSRAARREAAAARACLGSALDQGRYGRQPHHHHQCLGARRGVHACAHHRAGRHGDFPVPAQRLGDDHSRRHRAAGAARHRGNDVRARTTAWTICR